MKLKLMECSIRHASIRREISSSIKSYLSIFASSRRCRDIHISKLATLKLYVKVKMYNIRSDEIRRQITDFLYIGNSNVSSSLAIYEIFANLIKCQNLYSENESQCQ